MTTKFQIETFNNSRTEGSTTQRERREVDWDALTAHVVATAKAPKTRSIPGVISGYANLGIQPREPFEGPWNEKDAAKPGAEEYMNGKNRMVRVPQTDKPQIAFTVDFPQIMVDKSLYINGVSDPKPYRLLLNGEYGYRDSATGKWVPTVRRGYVVGEVKDDNGNWGISKQNTIYKLADACGIVPEDGVFKKEKIGDLVGSWAQFQIRTYVNDKGYLNEEIKLAGVLPEGVTLPEFDDSILYWVNFTNPDEASVKQLRNSIKNTIKRAANYANSDIQKLLEATDGSQSATGASPSAGSTPAPRSQQKSVQEVVDAPEGDDWTDPEESETPF